MADRIDQRAAGRGWLQQAGHDHGIQRLLRKRRCLHGHAKRAGHQPALFGQHVQIVKARAFGGVASSKADAAAIAMVWNPAGRTNPTLGMTVFRGGRKRGIYDIYDTYKPA